MKTTELKHPQEHLLRNELQQDLQFNPAVDTPPGYAVRSLIAVPLVLSLLPLSKRTGDVAAARRLALEGVEVVLLHGRVDAPGGVELEVPGPILLVAGTIALQVDLVRPVEARLLAAWEREQAND